MIGLTLTYDPPMTIGVKPILVHAHVDMLGMGNIHCTTLYKTIDIIFIIYKGHSDTKCASSAL